MRALSLGAERLAQVNHTGDLTQLSGKADREEGDGRPGWEGESTVLGDKDEGWTYSSCTLGLAQPHGRIEFSVPLICLP